MKFGDKKAYIFSSLFLAVAASICLFIGIQSVSKGYVTIFGHSLFRVVTGSMEPTIAIGAVLVCKNTGINDIEVDDIVCYRTEVADIYGSTVTHRVTDIVVYNGMVCLETRGDANVAADPYYVRSDNLIGKVIWYSGEESFVNDIITFLSGKTGFILCVVFPVLLISGLLLQGAVKSLQEDMVLVRKELADKEAELLPGYTLLTYEDYNTIYETLKKELLEELDGTEH